MDKDLKLQVNSDTSKTPTSIVNSVLEAAALLLPGSGYNKSTTNHIAEKAGVSIGSLYYYFRGKDAVYRKLADKIMGSYVERLERRLSTLSEANEIHEALVNEVVDFTFENRELLKTLFAMSSKLGKLETVFDLRNQFASGLSKRLSNVSEADTFILVNAINGVLDNYIYGTSCPLNKAEMKTALIRLATRTTNLSSVSQN